MATISPKISPIKVTCDSCNAAIGAKCLHKQGEVVGWKFKDEFCPSRILKAEKISHYPDNGYPELAIGFILNYLGVKIRR